MITLANGNGRSKLVSLNGVVYCGQHSCAGTDCDGGKVYPAGYLDTPAGRYFLRGSMTARGPVMQRCSPHASGPLVDLATVLTPDDAADLLTRWWG